ncbi:MAG: hypothetical protein ACXW61_16885 [Gemmatirosa sp.]
MRQLRELDGMTGMMRRGTLACATVLLVAACGGGSDTAATDSATGMTTGAMASDSAGMMAPGTATAGTPGSLSDASTVAQLDSVATAARSGLTSLAPAIAVPLIQSLEDKLDASNNPALTDIAKDLEKLREELNDAGGVNGGDVASILERLGPKVTSVASQGGAASGTLTAIGNELTRAATQLRGGSR